MIRLGIVLYHSCPFSPPDLTVWAKLKLAIFLLMQEGSAQNATDIADSIQAGYEEIDPGTELLSVTLGDK